MRLCEPAVILDEGHKATSDLARKTLEGFNASVVVELSATPPEDANVLVRVTGKELLDEQMIKLPINIANSNQKSWKDCLTQSKDKKSELEKKLKFKDTKDFIKRVPISIEQMRILVRIGGFSFTGKNKKELLWEIHTLISPVKRKESKNELFEVVHKEWKLPTLSTNKLDEAFDEMELLGFSLCSPFELLRDKITATLTAKELTQYSNKTVTIVGYLINVKNTQTSSGNRMCFGTFIDIEGRWIDTVHFPPSARQFPFIGPGCYTLTGKVVTEYDFTTVEVESMKRLAVVDREV